MERGVDFRVSTLKERKEFYEKEFSIAKVKSWFRENKIKLPQICAFDAGTDTGEIVDRKLKNKLLYLKFGDLPKKIPKYWPEDIYFDRNEYENPDKILETFDFMSYKNQGLVFDIDVDNIKKVNPKNRGEYLKILEKAFDFARSLESDLKSLGFEKISLIYSGRGFHIHVLDEKARKLNIQQRNSLSRKFFQKYPIDPWVSRGYIRLIRLPYSLNSVVSRIVTPIGSIKELGQDRVLPKFLSKVK